MSDVVFDGRCIRVDGTRVGGLHAFMRETIFPRLAHGLGGSSSSKDEGSAIDKELGAAIAAGAMRPKAPVAARRIWDAVVSAGYTWVDSQVGVATPFGTTKRPVATFADAVLHDAKGGIVIAEIKMGGESRAAAARQCPAPMGHLRQIVPNVGHVQVAATAAMYEASKGVRPVAAIVVRYLRRPKKRGGAAAVIEPCKAARGKMDAVSAGYAILGMQEPRRGPPQLGRTKRVRVEDGNDSGSTGGGRGQATLTAWLKPRAGAGGHK